MKKITFIIIMVITLFFLAGCNQVVCKDPYIQVGETCCLDVNKNNICDLEDPAEDEEKAGEEDFTCPTLDCDSCDLPKQECPTCEKCEKIVKYVCENGKVVDRAGLCFKDKTQKIEPNLSNEGPDSPIVNLTLRPFCLDHKNGAVINWELNRVPRDIHFQVREAESTEFETMYTAKNIFKNQNGFAVCEGSCYGNFDFNVKPDTAYLFRLYINMSHINEYNKMTEEYHYSNEHVIDTTLDSDLMELDCEEKSLY